MSKQKQQEDATRENVLKNKLEVAMKRIRQLEQEKEKLEAICLIHGILDFPAWMKKKDLIGQTLHLFDIGERQVPVEIQESLNQEL